MRTLLAGTSVLGAVLAGAISANAQVLVFGDPSGVDTFPTTTGSFGTGVGTAGVRAAGFTTGGVSLTFDHLALSVLSSGPAALRVRLATGTSTAPVSFVATLTTGGTLVSGSTVTMTASGSLELTANTTYWVVIDNTGSGGTTVTWRHSGNTPTASGGSGYFTQANGYTNTADDLSGTTGSITGSTYNLAVYTTTAVPEPSEYALVAGLGLCAFAVYRRRMAAAQS